jgi:hypothetical protein
MKKTLTKKNIKPSKSAKAPKSQKFANDSARPFRYGILDERDGVPFFEFMADRW